MKTFRFSLLLFTLAFAGMLSSISGQTVRAQSRRGISSNGTDFYLSRMPALPLSLSWQESWNGTLGGYFLIGSLFDNNPVTIDYFDAGSGQENKGTTIIIQKGQSVQYNIDPNSMTPSRPGEMPEYKSAHVHSKYPITVQYYYEGTSSGTLFQGIPTAGLGNHYVVAAYNDVPHDDAPNSENSDSSSSEFLIVAAFNNTTVTITPNSTTYKGIVGVNTGNGSNGQPHPITIQLQKGQVYWVLSAPTSVDNDLSGSTVVADKPIAVIGGQERAMINDPQGTGGYGDEDPRNPCMEEMIPVESWGTDYPSIPTMPASASDLNPSGDGDLYRVYSNDPNGVNVDMWQYTSPAQKYGPQGASLFQTPAANWQNVTEAVDFQTDPISKDASGNLKRMFPVQYLYFQWTPSNEMNYRSCEDMVLSPINRWITSTVFRVPKNTHYNGFQFINIITNKDSLRKINVLENGGSPGTLASFIPPVKQYQIPLHPELIGLTYQWPASTFMIYGNTPFACYSYGRTELTDKAVSGYAAPCGMAYGSFDSTPGPRVQVTPSCGQWNIHIDETNPQSEGIADIQLLNDPDAIIVHPAEVSNNVQLFPLNPTVTNLDGSDFVVGEKKADLIVQVADPTKPAFAAVYVVDRAGNDTVIQLSYMPPSVNFSQTLDKMPSILVGDTEHSTFTFHVNQTGNVETVEIDSAVWKYQDPDFTFTTVPKLPAFLHAGDSIVFTVSFTSVDTNLHHDTLSITTPCFADSMGIQARSVTPIIFAGDFDFGNVAVGDTVCHEIQIQNKGDAPLLVDSNWWTLNNPNFSFEGFSASLPVTIPPGGVVTVNFCFHPSETGASTGDMRWGSNLSGLFIRDLKDTSVVQGYGVAPGLSWRWHNQLFTVKCDAADTIRLWIDNTSNGSSGADLSVNGIHVVGPSASEFTLLDYGIAGGGGNPFPVSPFQLSKGGSEFVDVIFKANLSNGYADRFDSIVVNAVALNTDQTPYSDVLACIGRVRHADVAFTPPSYDFGLQLPGAVLTKSVTITNSGDTDFIFPAQNFNDATFQIVSGPKPGDLLAPGATDTFVIQYKAAQNGGISFDTLSERDGYCAFAFSAYKGSSELDSVTEIGHAYPVVYWCHDDSSAVSATNLSTFPMLLDSVEIMNAQPGTTDSTQFAFLKNGTQMIQLGGLPMAPDTTISFPVLYTPSSSSSVSAVAVFYYEDTSKGQQRFFTHRQPISGTGYSTTNEISLQGPAVADTVYTAVTTNSISVPVRLMLPFDSIAQVYGMDFTIRYYGDVFKAPTVNPAAGLSIASQSVGTDPSNSRYDLLHIQLGRNDGNPIENSGTVATVTMPYVVAKDSISPLQVVNLSFLDQQGDSECWVSQFAISSQFYGTNVCGDNTLRNFLKGGLPVLSIGSVVPNPVRRTAVVNYTVLEEGTPVSMHIYNALGEPVQTVLKSDPEAKGTHRIIIDASQLPSGLYTIFLTSQGYGISKQVLVTR